jgi:hypothetical protein
MLVKLSYEKGSFFQFASLRYARPSNADRGRPYRRNLHFVSDSYPPRPAKKPWLISRAYLAGLVEGCGIVSRGCMSCISTMRPSASMKAIERGL